MSQLVSWKLGANRPGSEPFPTRDVLTRTASGHGERRENYTVLVSYPWSWVWWPGTRPLVQEDPDQTDRRLRARQISNTQVDWFVVLHAVRYAVLKAQQTAGPKTAVSAFAVKMPFPLSRNEFRLTQYWVGDVAPVRYSYVSGEVEDGRHRLWFTREHARDFDVPVMSQLLIDNRFGTVAVRDRTASIEAMGDIWAAQDSDVLERNRMHQYHLARTYLELIAPRSLPKVWFERLSLGQPNIETLAEVFDMGCADGVLLGEVLVNVWSAKQDRAFVPPGTLVRMFGSLGFTADGEVVKGPRGTLKLFRGAAESSKLGASWTSDPRKAHYFAERNRTGAYMWTVTVPADRVVAFIRNEHEFIVDLTGLEDQVTLSPERPGTDQKTHRQAIKLMRRADRAQKRWRF